MSCISNLIAIIVACAVFCNSTVYGMELSDIKHLRVPLSGTARMDKVRERLDKDSLPADMKSWIDELTDPLTYEVLTNDPDKEAEELLKRAQNLWVEEGNHIKALELYLEIMDGFADNEEVRDRVAEEIRQTLGALFTLHTVWLGRAGGENVIELLEKAEITKLLRVAQSVLTKDRSIKEQPRKAKQRVEESVLDDFWFKGGPDFLEFLLGIRDFLKKEEVGVEKPRKGKEEEVPLKVSLFPLIEEAIKSLEDVRNKEMVARVIKRLSEEREIGLSFWLKEEAKDSLYGLLYLIDGIVERLKNEMGETKEEEIVEEVKEEVKEIASYPFRGKFPGICQLYYKIRKIGYIENVSKEMVIFMLILRKSKIELGIIKEITGYLMRDERGQKLLSGKSFEEISYLAGQILKALELQGNDPLKALEAVLIGYQGGWLVYTGINEELNQIITWAEEGSQPFKDVELKRWDELTDEGKRLCKVWIDSKYINMLGAPKANTEIIVAWLKGEYAGYLCYSWGGDVATIVNIVVDPLVRRKGIGTLLWQRAFEQIKDRGIIKITSTEIRITALKFWRKMVGRKNIKRDKFGKWKLNIKVANFTSSRAIKSKLNPAEEIRQEQIYNRCNSNRYSL